MQAIAFRVDGGQGVGMGHIIRCSALGQELKRMGCEVFFISAVEEGINTLKEQGFEVLCLKTTETNISETLNFINDKHADILIVDSYNVSQDYFDKLKKDIRKLVYIDDVNAFNYNIDILINYSMNTKEIDYKNLDKRVKLLLGPRYAILREQYQNIPSRKVRENVSEIMLTSGATDNFNTIPLFLKAILDDNQLSSKKIHVVIGNSFNNTEVIKDIALKNRNIILHQNVSDLSNIMLSSDLAISAGGSTLYELCACGMPALSYIIAKNQEKSVQALNKEGIIECLGWYEKLTTNIIAEKIKSICINYKKRQELSLKMQSLVDGKGAKRAAEEIIL
ncbi:MAG: UDP-2,4-diacetamido-2,4,6-trideoxy-beta-L-altropyranose hydrolase [Ignavibacteriales bacterium]